MYKEIFGAKKAVIFDLDGTIVPETVEIRRRAFEKVLKDLRLSYIDPRPFYAPGYPSENIWETIFNTHDIKGHKPKDMAEKTRHAYLELLKQTELDTADGFWDFYFELKEKNFKIALVSNSPREIQNLIIDKVEIKNLFDVEIFGDDIKNPKPDPEIFKKALKELKVKPKEAIVFENSIPGVEAANKADIDVIVIWDGLTDKWLYDEIPLEFSPDFTPYPGNMDKTHIEDLIESYKEVGEDK